MVEKLEVKNLTQLPEIKQIQVKFQNYSIHSATDLKTTKFDNQSDFDTNSEHYSENFHSEHSGWTEDNSTQPGTPTTVEAKRSPRLHVHTASRFFVKD